MTKVWDYTANSAYHNDVGDIGRDDSSGLEQKQSKSVNSDAILTMGLGVITTTNALNSNSFANNNIFRGLGQQQSKCNHHDHARYIQLSGLRYLRRPDQPHLEGAGDG